MNLTKLAAAAVVLSTLGACAAMQDWSEDAYVVRTATPDSITLEFRPGNLNVATDRAEAHCLASSRKAELEGVSTMGAKSLATFNCRY